MQSAVRDDEERRRRLWLIVKVHPCRGHRASSKRIGNHIIKINDCDIRPLPNGLPTSVRAITFPSSLSQILGVLAPLAVKPSFFAILAVVRATSWSSQASVTTTSLLSSTRYSPRACWSP